MSFEIQGRRRDRVHEPRQFIVESEIQDILSIRFPRPGELRVRKIVTRSRARRTQKYPSWKMDRMIQCESGNELVAARIYDLDSNVVSFHEQALAIRYRMADEEREHVPDFVVRASDGVYVDEIKDHRDRGNPEIIARTSFLTPLLARLGLKYRVRFVEKSRYQNTLGFCRSVLRFGRSDISQVEREAARRLFNSSPSLTWGDMKSGRIGERSRHIAARLILEGEICVEEHDRPLQKTSRLFTTKGAKGQFDLWAA